MVYIAYFTEFILQICDYAQKRRICRENCKYAFDESFHGHFCPRRLPTSATPDKRKLSLIISFFVGKRALCQWEEWSEALILTVSLTRLRFELLLKRRTSPQKRCFKSDLSSLPPTNQQSEQENNIILVEWLDANRKKHICFRRQSDTRKWYNRTNLG